VLVGDGFGASVQRAVVAGFVSLRRNSLPFAVRADPGEGIDALIASGAVVDA